MNNILQMMAMLKQMRENPIAMLSKRFNLPEGTPTDPQGIIDYLLKSGQISQGQLDQAREMSSLFTK